MITGSIRKKLSALREHLITKAVLLKSFRHDVSVGRGVYIAVGAKLSSPVIEIGDHTRINGKITIKGTGTVSIGKYCAIGADTKIISDMHIMDKPAIQVKFYSRNFGESLLHAKGDVRIGNDVWVGDSAIILSGVTVGDGAVIGAGAVVTKNVPPYTIVGGVPAKKIKDRFSDKIKEQLLQIKWWDWPEEKIKANREFFMMDLKDFSGGSLADFVR